MTSTPPFHITGTHRPGPWVITCDHASNRVPNWVAQGDLGLPASDMERHIAYDVGALGVALALGELLDSPVIASNFSRLVIDPNRGEDDPTLIMQLYDGTMIPANRSLPDTAIHERLDQLYRPYHTALDGLLSTRPKAAICAVHSFTPQLRGRARRPWHVGVLFAHDGRLSKPLIANLQADADLCIGVNEPYVGHLPGDAVDRHALSTGRQNTLIELRNDLIETPKDQAAWAARLAPHLTQALATAEGTQHG